MGTARALRVALIQSGRIVEDRTFTGRAKITVGTDAKSTFLVPMADVPVTTAVFDLTKKGTTLLFDAHTTGRVSLAGTQTTLQDCASRALPRGKQLALPLPDDAKGRVSIGEVSLLFQFVEPPKAAVAAELPKGARGLLAQVDRSFLAILALSLAAHFAGAGWLSAQPVPEEHELTIEEMNVDRFAAVMLRPIPRPQKTEPTGVAEVPKAPVAQPIKQPPVVNPQPSAAATLERVRKMGMAGIIGSRGDGTSAFGDIMKDTGMTDVATALRGAQDGMRVASIDDATATKRKGSDTGGTSQIDPIETDRVKNVNLREQGPAMPLNPRVTSEKVQLDTQDIDEKALSIWLNARKPAIQSCYERELKRVPKLQGRLVLRFAITNRGRVGGVGFAEDTLHNPQVEQCITAMMRGWVLPFTPEDDVPVSLPFIFAAGQ